MTYIEFARKDNQDFCALTSRKIKEYASNLTMDTGHFWDLEKEASGINDMQPIMVASGIFVCPKMVDFFIIQDIWYSRV